MKKTASLLVFIISFTLFSCKKEAPLQNNINLIGQSLSVVKRYATGNFQILYSYGGMGGGKILYDSTYIRISNDTITWTVRDSIYIHAKMTWKELNELTGVKTQVITFFDGSYPYLLAPVGNKDNLLVLCDETMDGYTYYLQRIP